MTAPRVLPLESWPEADRRMWDGLVAQGGLLDEAGALSHVRETTRQGLLMRYRQWLGWLEDVDPTALTELPEVRATAERLGRWVESLSHTAPVSRLSTVDGVLRVLTAAAPNQDWSRPNRLRMVLRRMARHAQSDRKVGRVLSSAVLLEAGLRHAGVGADAAPTPLEAAIRCRDGAMIATLAAMPMRRRAFADLEVGRSLEVTENELHVHLSPDMTKNGRPWSAAVPEAVAPVLLRYLQEARPMLLAHPRGAGASDALWITDTGVPFRAGYLADRIMRVTKALLGVPVSPHLFRDAAATTLSRASPEDARLIRPLLAHASFGIAERHYVHAGHIEAGRGYAGLVDSFLEAEAKSEPRHRP